jgi:hypothetical protein
VSRRTVTRPAETTRTVRLIVALSAMLASAGCIIASVLIWIQIPDGAAISGWGHIVGGQPDGNNTNINDALQGFTTTTYRPGVLAMIIGVLALLAAFGIAVVARGEKPHRIPASLLVLCGVGGIVWGLVRGIAPGDLASLYPGGVTASGTGPWLTAGCSLVLLAASVVVFTGVLDPPPQVRHRGIQPR